MQELLKHRQLVITLGLLYLAQGIPMGIAMDALPTLLRQEGSALSAIAFIPLVGLPWILKFLWAPIVDNYWFTSLGRRRSWIIPMQIIVTLCLLLLALIGISVEMAKWGVALLAIASLASATQDIATDGMAAEHASGTLLSKINAIQIAGVMGGIVTLFFGCGGGAWLINKIGVWRAFSAGLLCALGSSLLWLSQSTGMISLSLVAVCVVLGSLSSGITSVAIMTAGMRFASTDNQAGTDMTAVQSMRDIGEMACAIMLVSLTAVIGYSGGFGLAAVIALLALLVTLVNVKYQERYKLME